MIVLIMTKMAFQMQLIQTMTTMVFQIRQKVLEIVMEMVFQIILTQIAITMEQQILQNQVERIQTEMAKQIALPIQITMVFMIPTMRIMVEQQLLHQIATEMDQQTTQIQIVITMEQQISLRQVVQMLMVICLLYTSPSPRDRTRSRMPSSA